MSHPQKTDPAQKQILTGQRRFVPTSTECGSGADSEPFTGDYSPVSWVQSMKRAVRSSDELLKLLGLTGISLAETAPGFPTFVPLEFVKRMRQGDPDDPLLRQVLPIAAEAENVDGFVDDPVGDLAAISAPGVLHKYQGRALVITSGACGIHCRYCFRREFPYQESGSRSEAWLPSIKYLKDRTDVEEVLLSGGDPLTLLDEKFFELLEAIEGIQHIRRLRIHSRMPVVIPARVTDKLVKRLAASRLTVWMVIHANHAQEIDRSVIQATDKLVDNGIPVLNQAVLLRGVNDNVDALVDLCGKLVDQRIQPYYLHQLDRVVGAAHFEVPISRGQELVKQLRGKLPGYAVPTYVVEQSGEKSKTSLG